MGEDKLGEGKGIKARMVSRHEALFEVEITEKNTALLEILPQIGHMPLPPYIDRPDEEADKERYQTVYNKVPVRLRRQRAYILISRCWKN